MPTLFLFLRQLDVNHIQPINVSKLKLPRYKPDDVCSLKHVANSRSTPTTTNNNNYTKASSISSTYSKR